MKLVSLLVGVALVAAACGGGAQTGATAQSEVSVENFLFRPEEIAVPVGTTVTWLNGDEILHTATSGTPDEQSSVFDGTMATRGERFEHTFDAPGAFPYFCRRHPHMTGTIRVGE